MSDRANASGRDSGSAADARTASASDCRTARRIQAAPHSLRRNLPLALAGACALALIGLLSGPAPRPSAAQEATVTPTPRVIRVGRPRGTPSPAATPQVATTATPTPWLEIEGEMSPTPTPWLEIEDETQVSVLPTATPSPLPTATAAPLPAPTPLPTSTPTPIPPTPTATPLPVAPTIAPVQPGAVPTIAPATTTAIDFATEDWSGGYYRGDVLAYGWPWVAAIPRSSDAGPALATPHHEKAKLKFAVQASFCSSERHHGAKQSYHTSIPTAFIELDAAILPHLGHRGASDRCRASRAGAPRPRVETSGLARSCPQCGYGTR